ncbi:hypothetical protein L208DRAFT_1503595 [Tricholoma matsutake]|nr:hypothetical protein L208DRAFT_1503595 [Tricholoma matsutake 945]
MALPSVSVTTHPYSDGVHVPNDEHMRRRVFIGPMPEKVVSHTEAHALKLKKRGLFRIGTAQEEDDMEIIKQNAFKFFVHAGGRPEDWGEDQEQSTRQEMLQRWRNSEWGAVWGSRQKKESRIGPTSANWVGGSFEIGYLLDALQETGSTRNMMSSISTRVSTSKPQSHAEREPRPSTTSQEIFVSARSNFLPSAPGNNATGPSSTAGETFVSASSDFLPFASSDLDIDNGTPCVNALLKPSLDRVRPDGLDGSRAKTEPVVPRSIIRMPSFSATTDAQVHRDGKGKGKLVHYADIPPADQEASSPAPPSEVLERTDDAVEGTSAGATASGSLSPKAASLDWGDVVMRDRMLIRQCYTRSESIKPPFDEVQNRTTRNLQYGGWAEYMVAWRKDRVEIYEDHSLPGKEWMTGHKSLAFTIPLKSSKTHLSLYSFVDLTFCITCAPTTTRQEKSRWIFRRLKEGTNIFVFKLKSRSRAYDWVWQLWREMGGQLPNTIEVRNPRLDAKVKIDVPNAADDRIYKVFSRDNIIRLCMDSLRSVPDWKSVVERQMANGQTLQLAWRADTNLDWIWLQHDTYGDPRHWAVLCGLALKQTTRPPLLEIRIAEHYRAHIHLKNGSRLHEPPSIEGYLQRVRPNSSTTQNVYIATHDGNLFVLAPHRAHPPSPPGFASSTGDAESLRQSQTQRGTIQVMEATGVNDLRTILTIRRAFHLVPGATHNEKKPQVDDIWFSIWCQPEQRTPDDERDIGGEEGLTTSDDKPHLRMHRSFELLLDTGRVIRFEAHSRRVAVEWIERLRALVLYWKQRHRVDAEQEMELAQARRPRLTPQMRAFHESEYPPEAPADPSTPLPALVSMFNWCVLDGCKAIIKGGKAFMRRGLHGQYKLIQLFLVTGHLVMFRITPGSSLHLAMRRTNLLDAYVCSGYFAALALPEGQYDPTTSPEARRYQDGLETDDPEEDILFMVWFRRQPSVVEKASLPGSTTGMPNTVPALSAKGNVLVFRTRSKLERDAWCWALNSEIERVVRAQKEREARLKETGNLMNL